MNAHTERQTHTHTNHHTAVFVINCINLKRLLFVTVPLIYKMHFSRGMDKSSWLNDAVWKVLFVHFFLKSLYLILKYNYCQTVYGNQ